MGSIDIIKPMSSVLSSALGKSQQHQEKNSWECRESNLGLLGEKQVCYLCAMQPLLSLCYFRYLLESETLAFTGAHLIGRFSRLLLQGPAGRDEHDDIHRVSGQLLLDDGDGVAGGHALDHVAAL